MQGYQGSWVVIVRRHNLEAIIEFEDPHWITTNRTWGYPNNKTRQTSKNSMRPKFQSKQSVIINAPLKKVWEFSQDLSRIAEYHPRVNQVELISGKQFREAGASYKCHLSDGRNTCVEKDIEIVPMEKIVTILPSDTMGLTKLLPDYLVETTFKSLDDKTTLVEISQVYSSSKWKVWLLNFIIKRKVAMETLDTLNAAKRNIENER